MLIGHSAHLIRNDLDELFIYCWGGGGSCFSFGTHFNTVNVRISLPSNWFVKDEYKNMKKRWIAIDVFSSFLFRQLSNLMKLNQVYFIRT